MIRAVGIAGPLPAAIVALSCAAGPPAGVDLAPGDAEPPEPVLVGEVNREEIEAALPDWIGAQVEARPDLEAAAAMASAGDGARVTVYLGTWCSDSRRELARLWRAMDEAGGEVAFEIAYVGVDRAKEEPADRLAGLGLEYVPTFVVEIGGAETGRIVEESPNGIERDLGALLRGEVSGLVTAKEELLRR